eukprot:6233840-Pyramimonas_sp.AAC.1
MHAVRNDGNNAPILECRPRSSASTTAISMGKKARGTPAHKNVGAKPTREQGGKSARQSQGRRE